MIWTAAIVGVMALIGGGAFLPSVRRGAVQREAVKVAKAAYPAEPGEDWPALWTRLNRRYLSTWIGASVGLAVVLAAFAAFSAETIAAGASYFGILTLCACRTIGTIVGHLRSLRLRPGAARLVTLHRRELRDYLLPGEAVLLRLAPAVPLAAIVYGVALAGVEAASPTLWLGIVGGGVMGLGVGLLAVPLARRTLAAPADATTAGGLVWAEVLRAMSLRDICAGMWSLAATGAGLPLIPLLTDARGSERWVIAPAAGIGVAAATVVCGLAWVAASDINHQWARRHALEGVV
ncbi:hypothetical protein [Pedococcus sp. P5_B7]